MKEPEHQEIKGPYKERGENWAKLSTLKIDDLRKSNLAIYVKYEEELQEAYTSAVKKLRELFSL